MDELTLFEVGRLEQCEAVIERGLKTFTDVGNALLEIRDSKLYRREWGTFEDYCRGKWGLKQSRAYQLMDAAKVIGNLESSTIVELLPANEAQARPLMAIEPEQQQYVWQQVIDTAPIGGITAAYVQQVVEEVRTGTRPENIHVSDDSYEWYTPVEYIDAARFVMGGIDLDPASSDDAQAIIGASEYYTKEVDGLSREWFGRVWINPPYCMPDIENFIDRAIAEYNEGAIKSAVILTNNSTDAGWFHRMLNAAGIACLTKGRVKFWGPNASQSQARQGQALFYLGNEPDKFRDEFRKFGIVVGVE